MRRRKLLKSAPIAVASHSIGPKTIAGKLGPNSLEDLEKDFQRYKEKHGEVTGYEKFVSGSTPNETLHVTRGAKKEKSLRPGRKAKKQTNRATDVFKFEDGSTKSLTYFVKNKNVIEARWDGNKYRTRSTDPLGQRLFEQGTEITQNRSSGPKKAKKGVETLSHKEHIANAGGLSDGRADDSGILGGLAKTRSDHSYDECEAHVQSAGAARGWAKAEVYSEVDLTDLSYGSVASIEAEGYYRGAVGAGLSAGYAHGELFVRDTGDSWVEDDIDRERFIDLNLGIIDMWGSHSSYDTTLLTELDPDTYEVGIRVDLSGKNLSVSASNMDFHNDDGLDNDFPGYLNNSYIAVYER